MKVLYGPIARLLAVSVALAPLAVTQALAQNSEAGTRQYAEYRGVSTSEASKRMQFEHDAGALNGRLAREQPDTFAGLYIEHDPEFRVVVRFTGDAAKQLAKYTKDPVFVAENAPRSLELLRATQEEIGVQLTSAKMDFASEVDVRTSSLIVYVLDPDHAGEVLSKLLGAVDFVTIKETPGFIQTTNVSGGRLLEGATQSCTSGFNVVEDLTGELGILTAGHCDDNNTHRNPTVSILFKGQAAAGSFDVQWGAQRKNGVIWPQKNEIIAGGSTLSITDEASLSDMTVGRSVCKSGMVTGVTCGTIVDPEFAANFNNVAGTYVRVASGNGSLMNDHGDSGGPVYFGNTAFGLVHGRGNPGTPWANDLFFMPIERISPLGVSVITEKFELESVPDVSGTGASIPVAMNFTGHPRFPLKLTLEIVTCPPGWLCRGGSHTYQTYAPSPAMFNWVCQRSNPGETKVGRIRTVLKDGSGITTRKIESNVTCTF